MEKIIIYTVIVILVIAVIVLAIVVRNQNIIYKLQLQLINDLMLNADELLRHSMQFVLAEAVKREDYETARKCKELLDKITNTPNP